MTVGVLVVLEVVQVVVVMVLKAVLVMVVVGMVVAVVKVLEMVVVGGGSGGGKGSDCDDGSLGGVNDPAQYLHSDFPEPRPPHRPRTRRWEWYESGGRSANHNLP